MSKIGELLNIIAVVHNTRRCQCTLNGLTLFISATSFREIPHKDIVLFTNKS
jgi:hypothetical protein